MKIKQARSESDWMLASEILVRVIKRLNELGRPLWTDDQVSVFGLQQTYRINELRFLEESSCCIGLVFLQEEDYFFWPDIVDKDSLYIHKLAIDPPVSGAGMGALAVEAVVREAEARGFSWVRLDCDDRPELHYFYQSCGFDLVDVKEIDVYQVARYQRLTSDCDPKST